MSNDIGILDRDYLQWVKKLGSRYRRAQIKAAVKVNQEFLRFYWELGRDIEEMQAENKYGSGFYATLSHDIRLELPDVDGLSETTIRYAKRFYVLYSGLIGNLPQLEEESPNLPQVGEDFQNDIVQQLAGRIKNDIFSIPWGHHKCIIDKCSSDPKCIFRS